MATQETFTIDECEEAFVRDFCPYKGSPDPLVVWRAAWNSAVAAERERLASLAESNEDSAGFRSLSAAEIRAGRIGA